MLRLQYYNLEVIYKAVRHTYIADHLSRAPVSDSGTPATEFQVFALELVIRCPLTTVKINSERLAQQQEATETKRCNANNEVLADEKDPGSALLDYRNMPTEGMKSSPCQ